MVSPNPSSLLTNTGNLLRKRRKRLVPYKGKWQQALNEQQAMDALNKQLTQSSPLLSTLLSIFSLYDCPPTPSAYTLLINSLTQSFQFNQLPSILNHIQHHSNFTLPEQIFIRLIRSYGSLDRINDAVDLFFRIPSFRCTPTALSLNALLSVLCKSKKGLEMVYDVLFKSSKDMKIRLEESSFRILISALCRVKKIGYAIEMLELMLEFEYEPDSELYSLILSALCRIECVEVMCFLEEMREKGFCPSGRDYMNVIRCLVKAGKVKDSFKLLNQMKGEGMKPNVVVYTCVLNGVIMDGEFEKAEELFDEMLVLGVAPDIHTYNVYLKGLCMQNKFEAGCKLISCMEELGCQPDVCTYNTIIQAFCKVGNVKRVREDVLRKMRSKGIEWDVQTYISMINGLMNEGEAVEACKLVGDMLSRGFVPASLTCDEFICWLCKRGLVFEALQVLKAVGEKGGTPGDSAWEALISVSELSLEETTSLDLILG
ncbi:hypothetical protein ACHQM5_029037 [Ranunculus cassubicifolius]